MGVKQWIFQRVSNFVIILFGLWLLGILAGAEQITASTISTILADGTTRLFLIVTLVLACLNSMLAGWQIAGDYAQKVGLSDAIFTWFGIIVSLGYLACGLSFLL